MAKSPCGMTASSCHHDQVLFRVTTRSTGSNLQSLTVNCAGARSTYIALILQRAVRDLLTNRPPARSTSISTGGGCLRCCGCNTYCLWSNSQVASIFLVQLRVRTSRVCVFRFVYGLSAMHPFLRVMDVMSVELTVNH